MSIINNINNFTITNVFGVGVANWEKGHSDSVVNRPTNGFSIKLSGSTLYRYNNKEYISDPNHIIFLKKGPTYKWKCIEQGECIIINFDMLNGAFDFESIPVHNNETIQRIATEAKVVFEAQKKGYIIVLKTIIYNLLLAVLSSQEIDKCENVKINKALFFIKQNIKKHVSNTEIANHCHISEVYLRKLFNKCLGLTPQKYIMNVKIEYAKKMLSQSNKSIFEIASDLGFYDIYSFSKAFKKQTSFTPSYYRKEYILFA